ncbi:MAG: SPOR domain-containing protein [Proteobacteria bacterium]|nr:SPOR domain-containing protein [Pseudomonadota bacterium]
MMAGKLSSWRIPLVVFAFVCVGILTFGAVQFWAKGRLPDSEVLDLSFAQTIQKDTHRAALQPQIDEPYHYDFFTLLEQPVPDRALPEFEMEQNPAIRAKARHSLNKLSGKYAIQVSSFKSASDAQTLVRQLNVQGYHAVVVSETVNGQGWYRVRVDGGAKREVAENLQATIQKKTGLKGFVVTL